MSDKPKKAAAKKTTATKAKPAAKVAKVAAPAKAKPKAVKKSAVKTAATKSSSVKPRKTAISKAAAAPKAAATVRKAGSRAPKAPKAKAAAADAELGLFESPPVTAGAASAAPAIEPQVAPAEAAPTPPPQEVRLLSVQAREPQAEAAPAAPASSGQSQQDASSQEGGGSRRKARWERWKERRERFKAEKLARRLGGGGAGPSAESSARPAHHHASSHDEEPSMPPETVLGPPEPVAGVLELNPKGHGFLRLRERGFAQHPADAYVNSDVIRQLGLREGMWLETTAQKGPRGLMVTKVTEVDGRVPESVRDLPLFEELKAINPNKRIPFETTQERVTTRVLDMFTPIGRGQRGLIVAPPRTGKTTLLQHIAEAVVQNHPTMKLMILLVDERPEEVTEFKRIFTNAEIYASSNDQDVRSHTRIATLAIERAKRLVECGEHVFMLMDSITRLARAFNNAKSGGATMSGGMGVGAMEIPRRLFAAARNTRGAGSLTILATALIETGSRMDDLIFLEFKGTGNMELVLDRKLAEQYYYPAVNIFKSGTRREELLLPPFQLDKIHMLRRGLAGGKPIDAIQRVITLCERYPGNAQMLVELPGRSS